MWSSTCRSLPYFHSFANSFDTLGNLSSLTGILQQLGSRGRILEAGYLTFPSYRSSPGVGSPAHKLFGTGRRPAVRLVSSCPWGGVWEIYRTEQEVHRGFGEAPHAHCKAGPANPASISRWLQQHAITVRCLSGLPLQDQFKHGQCPRVLSPSVKHQNPEPLILPLHQIQGFLPILLYQVRQRYLCPWR